MRLYFSRGRWRLVSGWFVLPLPGVGHRLWRWLARRPVVVKRR